MQTMFKKLFEALINIESKKKKKKEKRFTEKGQLRILEKPNI